MPLTDEEHAARVKAKAMDLCAEMNAAAKSGLHIQIELKPYCHSSMDRNVGNLASDFKPHITVRRERWLSCGLN